MSSMVRWMDPHSWPMSSRCSCQHWQKVTSCPQIVREHDVLVPTLAKGDIVFADNLRTHKIDGVRQAIAAIGATIRYLPAYSPDLNPIEMAFAKLKAALRKGAKRTVKELWRLIGKLVKSFTSNQCANYFRHAGYRR